MIKGNVWDQFDRLLVDMNDSIKFSKILKELMKREKVSPKTLSEACSIPQSTLSTYLSGDKESYSPRHLLSIANYFGVSIDYLLTMRDRPIKGLNSLPVEKVFDGWLRVKIERAIPTDKE